MMMFMLINIAFLVVNRLLCKVTVDLRDPHGPLKRCVCFVVSLKKGMTRNNLKWFIQTCFTRSYFTFLALAKIRF